MSRTLVIVDMQPDYFPTARNETVVGNICREIKKARNRRAGIVVVEYNNCGKTDKRILKSIGKYHRHVCVTKKEDSGGKEVFKAAIQSDFDISKWRVCGVNIAYCINETVIDLSLKMHNKASIEIQKDACNCLGPVDSSMEILRRCNGQEVRTV